MSLLKTLQHKPLIGDGAMGTMLYTKGIFINTCYEQLCLTNPDLIESVHRDYVEAGADLIETNTFGANRLKLEAHGMADQLEAINRAAVHITRKVAGSDTFILGSVGPYSNPTNFSMIDIPPNWKTSSMNKSQYLPMRKVDAIQLETFTHVDEAELAAQVASSYHLPVFVSITVGKDGETRRGERIEQIISKLDACDAIDALGINCGVGPAAAFSIAERALPLTSKPFSVNANAGLPQEVDGRLIYMSTLNILVNMLNDSSNLAFAWSEAAVAPPPNTLPPWRNKLNHSQG